MQSDNAGSEADVNRAKEEITNQENADMAAVGETPDVQPEELSEGEFISVNGKGGF